MPTNDAIQLSGYGLETEEMRAIESLVLRLLASPSVKAAQKDVEAIYRADSIYRLPGAAAILGDAVRELLHQTATYVVTEDPQRPKLLWTYTAPRNGYLGSRFIESVDSVYRVVTVGAGHRYEIRGRRPPDGPAYITFEVWNAAQGLAPEVKYVTHLEDDELVTDVAGRYTVTAGPEPREGRTNHLSVPQGGWIIIRESLSDWQRQSPSQEMSVRLVGEVTSPPPNFEALEQRLVQVMPQAAQIILTYMHRMFEEHSGANLYIAYGNRVNHLNPRVTTRGGAWGYVTGTTYQLADDEALLVTISSDDARYYAAQLHDPWGRTLDPMFLTNRNNSVSAPNADGSVTFAICGRDPGIANWLDTRGFGAGSIILRWQGIRHSDDASPALIRESALVPIDRLRKLPPVGVRTCSAAARQRELARRFAGYERRFR